MGQKINPIGFHVGINKNWKSQWCVARQDYVEVLHEDLKIRRCVENFTDFQNADIADLEIIRHPQKINLVIHTSRPGVVIGNKGVTIDKLSNCLKKMIGRTVIVKIKEIKKAEIVAQVVALNVAKNLKGRMPFRRVMKNTIASAIRNGAQGIKIRIAGRLGGAEMAREFSLKEGRVPLQTIRAEIDYGFAEARTTYGVIGVKVWIYKGEFDAAQGYKNTDAGDVVKARGSKKQGVENA